MIGEKLQNLFEQKRNEKRVSFWIVDGMESMVFESRKQAEDYCKNIYNPSTELSQVYNIRKVTIEQEGKAPFATEVPKDNKQHLREWLIPMVSDILKGENSDVIDLSFQINQELFKQVAKEEGLDPQVLVDRYTRYTEKTINKLFPKVLEKVNNLISNYPPGEIIVFDRSNDNYFLKNKITLEFPQLYIDGELLDLYIGINMNEPGTIEIELDSPRYFARLSQMACLPEYRKLARLETLKPELFSALENMKSKKKEEKIYGSRRRFRL